MAPGKFLLATLNSRYSHASFGLRYLKANAGAWYDHVGIREFTIHDRPIDVVERLLAEDPSAIGFGVYIWNVRETTEIVAALKALRPGMPIIIGGPEVSYEYEQTAIFNLADHLVTGEGEPAFRRLLDAHFDEAKSLTELPKVVQEALPEPATLSLPYGEYTDEDLRNRLIYVEASRGCPFKCEFCLSSLEIPVRAFPIEAFLTSLRSLLDRGARAFKFVDRTFNLNVKFSSAILEFCLENCPPEFELHFEMIPDRLPPALRELIRQFPPGMVQLEIGIQTLTDDVVARISRRQNVDKLRENFRFLREETGVHIHADLIFGLPGETLETFGLSFDKLYEMDPGEIQIGVLKRLRGTPISRHSESYRMVYQPEPPYEILENADVPFAMMQRMKRFARYFDLYANSGNFEISMRRLFESGSDGPFTAFLQFADWLYEQTGQTHKFALTRLFRLLFAYLTDKGIADRETLALEMLDDYDRKKIRPERLEFLRAYVPAGPLVPRPL